MRAKEHYSSSSLKKGNNKIKTRPNYNWYFTIQLVKADKCSIF